MNASATNVVFASAPVEIVVPPTTFYAVRLSDGSFLQGRKPQGDEGGFLVWTDPANAGNAVHNRKDAGKLAEDADYEVVAIGVQT